MKRKNYKKIRESCLLCGKHKTITESHHLREFKNANDDLEIYGEYKSKLIWLCPNCHTYTHECLYKLFSKKETT